MNQFSDQINKIQDRIDLLVKKQNQFFNEIEELRVTIHELQNSQNELTNDCVENPSQIDDNSRMDLTTDESVKRDDYSLLVDAENEHIDKRADNEKLYNNKAPKVKSDLEKFIGENLINKVGIAITIIGVAIGAKYSIENNLISPLTRIIMGYLAGVLLLAFGVKLKKKYENYSSVLVSGAMAIMYFITYLAYDFYGLIPETVAFSCMLIFTVFTVYAAINYNRQLIAHIGLVGAYAVPFLLSDGSGNVAILFLYMTILNVGILVIAFKKYWKKLYYVSFGLTWLIFLSWFVSDYHSSEHFKLALVFITIFFLVFYVTFLAYKFLHNEEFVIDDVFLLMFNSFVFYGLGYLIFEGHTIGEQFVGLFTLVNAVIHFIVSAVIHRRKLADRNIYYLVAGLVLVFITIAIPVQLDGNWVTLLWAGESALLFWISRTKNVFFYEKLSYPLILLSFISILQDWLLLGAFYTPELTTTKITPILNLNFLSSLIFIVFFVFINYVNSSKKFSLSLEKQKDIPKIITFAIPVILVFAIYFAFQMEISIYWDQLFADSMIKIKRASYSFTYFNYDLIRFKSIWIINYSLFFISALTLVNVKKIRNKQFELINNVLIVSVLFVFLSAGLYVLSELRDSYLHQIFSNYYPKQYLNLWIRYISFLFVSFLLYASYQVVKQNTLQRIYKMAFELLLHTTILWILSSELINWMDIAHSDQSYKLGLSILWGLYSLFLIVVGIWKNNRPMRIGAITLFGLTLIKLFFYDISHLNTIAKTIVFVSLGVLLLIISFLYNKYKHLITDDINEI